MILQSSPLRTNTLSIFLLSNGHIGSDSRLNFSVSNKKASAEITVIVWSELYIGMVICDVFPARPHAHEVGNHLHIHLRIQMELPTICFPLYVNQEMPQRTTMWSDFSTSLWLNIQKVTVEDWNRNCFFAWWAPELTTTTAFEYRQQTRELIYFVMKIFNFCSHKKEGEKNEEKKFRVEEKKRSEWEIYANNFQTLQTRWYEIFSQLKILSAHASLVTW